MKLLQQFPQTQAVLFDLDGTLVDSAPDIALAINQVMQEIQTQPVTLAQVKQWVGRGAMQLMHCVVEAQGINPRQYDDLLARFMLAYGQTVCVESKLYPHVAEFLAQCQQAGLKMAVVTNKPEQPAVDLLDILGIAHYFKPIVGGDTLPVRKPDPRPITHALACIGVSAEHAIMIGDSRNDVEAARAAGVYCYALSYGYNHGEPLAACQPDKILDSLQELI